jgi:hypothetical protein
MFSPTVGKSKWSYALSEMSYFYDVEKTGTFGVRNRILRDIEKELFKPHETGPLQGEPAQMGSLI